MIQITRNCPVCGKPVVAEIETYEDDNAIVCEDPIQCPECGSYLAVSISIDLFDLREQTETI